MLPALLGIVACDNFAWRSCIGSSNAVVSVSVSGFARRTRFRLCPFAALVVVLLHGCCFAAAAPITILCTVVRRSLALYCQDLSPPRLWGELAGPQHRRPPWLSGCGNHQHRLSAGEPVLSAWSAELPRVAVVDTRSSPPGRQTISDARLLPRPASVAHAPCVALSQCFCSTRRFTLVVNVISLLSDPWSSTIRGWSSAINRCHLSATP